MAGVLAVTVALSACAAASPAVIDLPTQVDGGFPEDTTTQLQDAVTFAMAAAGASGAIVGVWAPWSGSWVTGLGTQNVGGGRRDVSTEMQFRAAQETRPMTCDVLYALEAKGAVSGSDSVTEYVAGVSDLEDITLDQLCDGTSGIGSYARRCCCRSGSRIPIGCGTPANSPATGSARTAPGRAPPTPARTPRTCCSGSRSSAHRAQTANQLLDEYVLQPTRARRDDAAGGFRGTSRR